jgi:predicted lactoylglutathione lyase
MDSLTPNIFVKDINETIEFYKKIGFQVAMTVPEKQLTHSLVKAGSG